MSQKMVHGHFRTALRQSGKSSLFSSVPVIGGIWLAVLFVPWEMFFEDNGAAPLGIATWRKLMNFGEAPFPWLTLLLTAFVILMLISETSRGLKALNNPEKHDGFQALKTYGEPFDIVSRFETEAAHRIILEWSKPRLIATMNHLMIQKDTDIVLVPTEKIMWVYDERDASSGAVTFLARSSGMISRRQAAISEQLDDKTLVLWMQGKPDPVKISVPPAYDDLIEYLLDLNDQVIIGFHPKLRKLWDADRDGFKAAAQAYIANNGKAGQEDSLSSMIDSLMAGVPDADDDGNNTPV